MAEDLIDLDEHLDATDDKASQHPFDPQAFDDLILAIVNAINNKLLRAGGGLGLSDDLNMGGNDIIELGDIIGVDSQGNQDWRIFWDENNSEWELQQNTGTDENPVWTTRLLMELSAAGELFVRGCKVWTECNDGAGSGLDADTLDGFEALTLLGDSAGTVVDIRFDTEEASQGQTNFTLDDFDPKDEQPVVFSGGVMMTPGAGHDYERTDEEGTVANSTGNDGTYTIRTPEVSFDAGTNQTTVPVVENIPDTTADGDMTIDGNTYGIASIDEDDNSFVLVGDASADPDDSFIVFNSGREDGEKVTAVIFRFVSPGAGGGFDADLLDGKHGSFFEPTVGTGTDDWNDEEHTGFLNAGESEVVTFDHKYQTGAPAVFNNNSDTGEERQPLALRNVSRDANGNIESITVFNTYEDSGSYYRVLMFGLVA